MQIFGDLVPLEQYRIALRNQAARMSWLSRLLGRAELPAGFPGRLDPDERVVAAATTGEGDPLVVTSHGLWLAEPDGGARRVGWHLVSKATWQSGTLTVTRPPRWTWSRVRC